ncbi:MAG: hypothetical protein IPK31_02945 [Chitinophagaceae bacterium]|nr:hypothetical protein [Chitinophagaceae bacterium]
MSSNLEKFINRHRSDFDTEHPSEDVWKKIEATIPVKKEANRFSIRDLYKWTAAAAIVCIVLTSVYFLYIRQQRKEITRTEQQNNRPDHLSGIDPEYTAEVKQAFLAIQTRQEELKDATTGRPELYKQFSDDLRVLDSSYRMLQTQAAQSPNRDVIMKAMIQNLQLQAELLYRQLMITNEIKNNKTQKNEKII